jgi:23S rRNA-/tRNA-specific pseudouridylate synthase
MKTYVYTKKESSDGSSQERLDVFLMRVLKNEFEISRSLISKSIPVGVSVNNKKAKASLILREGDSVVIDIDLLQNRLNSKKNALKQEYDIKPIKGDISVIYEDESILVLNKPCGIPMHPGASDSEPVTMANLVRYYLESKSEYDNGIINGGVVHRLDKSVSGVTIWAKNSSVQKELRDVFKGRGVKKVYKASIERLSGTQDRLLLLEENKWNLIEGYVLRDGSNRLRRKFVQNITENEAKFAKKASLKIIKIGSEVYIQLLTGRNHQIRATLKYLGYTITGDTLYSGGKNKLVIPDAIKLQAIAVGLKLGEMGFRMWAIGQYPALEV